MADPPRYRAIQINAPDNPDNDSAGPQLDTQAFGINDKGEVVGQTQRIGGAPSGLLWLPDNAYGAAAGQHKLFGIGSHNITSARRINNHGRVVGWSEVGWETLPRFWNLPAGTPFDSIAIPSGPLVGQIIDINNDDVVVSTHIDPFPLGFLIQWDTTFQSLVTLEPHIPLENGGTSYGTAIGDTGVAAGQRSYFPPQLCVQVCGSFTSGAWWPNPMSAAVLGSYDEHQCTLDTIGPYDWGSGELVRSINMHNRMVGAAYDPNWSPVGCLNIATFWKTPDAAPMRLPWPVGQEDERTEAHSISDPVDGHDFVYAAGQNVDELLAILWRVPVDRIGDGDQSDWDAFDLNDPALVNLNETEFTILLQATGVNNMGWISGWGEIGLFEHRAFVLIPLDRCEGDLTGPLGLPDGKIGVPDLLELLSHWGDCPVATPCWADLDGNGTVGVPDLLILLANWGYCPGNSSTDTLLPFAEEIQALNIRDGSWEDFLDILKNDPRTEQDRWLCWFERYLNGCTNCRTCRGTDPFEK